MSVPDHPRLSLSGDSLIKVSGCLDVTTVSRSKESGEALIDKVDVPVFDLAEAEVTGSAAIALLIAWQRHAFKVGKEIRFINSPGNLLDIARACGVDEILSFAVEPSGA